MGRYLNAVPILWAFLLCFFNGSFAQDPNLHIYLYLGQSNDMFTFQLQGIYSYQLTSASGSILEQGSGTDLLNVGINCPKGLFFLKLQQENHMWIGKLVKK